MKLTEQQERTISMLTGSMLKCLRIAERGGLKHTPGGRWISNDAKRIGQRGQRYRSLSVQKQTVEALEARKMLTQDLDHDVPEYLRRRLLTNLGREALADTNDPWHRLANGTEDDQAALVGLVFTAGLSDIAGGDDVTVAEQHGLVRHGRLTREGLKVLECRPRG